MQALINEKVCQRHPKAESNTRKTAMQRHLHNLPDSFPLVFGILGALSQLSAAQRSVKFQRAKQVPTTHPRLQTCKDQEFLAEKSGGFLRRGLTVNLLEARANLQSALQCASLMAQKSLWVSGGRSLNATVNVSKTSTQRWREEHG